MIGGNPWWLLGLWILPVLAGLLYRAQRRTAAAAGQFAEGAMQDRLMPARGPLRPWIRGGLLLLGVGLMIVAAARPRFGEYYEWVATRGVDLFVLLDVSRSMLAEDVAPNRLGRARSDIRDLLEKLPGDRVGLIAFAGAPALLVPLTTDQGFFLAALEAVDTDSAPRGGSLIGDAIRKALQSLEERRDRDQVLVLITDGEDHDSFPLEAAEQAAERGVRIFTVGLGDPEEGMRIPIRDDSGELRYLEYEGQAVRSRMDEGLLNQIAVKTQGAYVPARTRAYDLGQIYEEHLAKLTRSEMQSAKQQRYADQFQWFLFLGLAALLAQMLISPYPRTAAAAAPPVAAPAPRRSRRLVRAGGLWLAAVWCMGGSTAAGAGIRDAADHVREGLQQFERGEYEAAERLFAQADAALPHDPRIGFNQACAAAAAGRTEQANLLFQQAGVARDPQLAAEAHYNLGGLAAQRGKTAFGDKPEEAGPEVRQQGLEHLLQAIGHWRDCLRIQPGHAAARHNLELLRQWIKQMQDVWAARDRQQRRDSMSLLEMLQWLQQRQELLRQAARGLATEDDSPRRRQAIAQSAGEQRLLGEEVSALEDKLREEFQPQQAPHPAAGPGPAEAAQALKVLLELAAQARRAMDNAADRLEAQALAEAALEQARAVDRFNDIYTLLAPFTELLQKAIARQESLIEATQQVTAAHSEPPPTPTTPPADVPELARSQAIVDGWSRMLPAKAEHELQQLPPVAAGPPRREDPQPPEGSAASLLDLQAALKKAIEWGPQIQQSTGEARQQLEQNRPAEALPPQQQALRLLQEIAGLLPHQPPPDQPPDQPPDADPQEQPKEQPEQPQQEQAEQPSSRESPQPRQISQQQAQTMMQRVREREREHRELQKQLQRLAPGGIIVEKDW